MTPNYFILPGLESKQKLGPWLDKEIVIHTICQHMEIGRDKIESKARVRPVSYCRHLIFYFLRTHTNLTYLQIATLFGKDHSTVIHGYETIKDLLQVDTNVKDQIELLKTKIINNHL